jgi:hypothetical protein
MGEGFSTPCEFRLGVNPRIACSPVTVLGVDACRLNRQKNAECMDMTAVVEAVR